MAHNSTYSGVQVDAAVAKILEAETNGGVASKIWVNNKFLNCGDLKGVSSISNIATEDNGIPLRFYTSDGVGAFLQADCLSLAQSSIYDGVFSWQTPDFNSYCFICGSHAQFGGAIVTSFHGAKAIGSQGFAATDPAAFINQIKYSNGLMGSVSFNGGTTWNGISCSGQWYSFIWIPHRSGGNGFSGPDGDNCNWGTLLLFPMSFVSSSNYRIQYTNSTVQTPVTF